MSNIIEDELHASSGSSEMSYGKLEWGMIIALPMLLAETWAAPLNLVSVPRMEISA